MPQQNRSNRRSSPFVVLTAAGLAVAAASGLASGQTYVGPPQGLWSEPTNWDPAHVPDNSDGDDHDVILPTDAWVTFDLPLPTMITNAQFQPGSRIDLSHTSLEVENGAALELTFIYAHGPSAGFYTRDQWATGSSQRVDVSDGARVQLGLVNYIANFAGWNSGVKIFSADGPDALLEFPVATQLDARGSYGNNIYGYGTRYFEMIAREGGSISFPAVTSLKGTRPTDDDWLRIRAEVGGVIDLAQLDNIPDGDTWFDLAGGTINLPNLKTVSSTTKFSAPASEVLNLPALTSARQAVFVPDSGSTVHAPLLTDFTGSYLALPPSVDWDVPEFTSADTARFSLSGDAALVVADADYYGSFGGWNSGAELFLVNGPGSLDFPNATLIDATGSYGNSIYGYGTRDFWIRAIGGGAINLPSVTTIRGTKPSDDDWLRIRAESGGTIDLSALTTVTGGDTWFELLGGTIDLASLTNIDATTKFTIPTFESLDLPSLVSARYTTFALEPISTLNAPLLSDFTGSYLALTPTTQWNAPPLETIDSARFVIAEGASFSVADDQFIASFAGWNDGATILSCSDSGSLLDLSSVAYLDATGSYGNSIYGYGTRYFWISALNGGTIDLSGVTTLRGTKPTDDDWLRLRIGGGDSVVRFGGASHDEGDLWLEVLPGGSVEAVGGISLGIAGGTPRLSVSSGQLLVGGDFLHRITDEAWHATSAGTLHLNGTDLQQFEIAGADLGLPSGPIGDNFDWGELIVGQDAQPTTVLLTDSINNGNRGGGGEPEALYVSGFEGLSIRGGSTLVLNDLQAYTFDASLNDWVHLNALFGPEDFRIPYDGGFLQASLCSADLNGDGVINTQDFIAFLDAWAHGDPLADWNEDGAIDTQDFIAYLDAWAVGC